MHVFLTEMFFLSYVHETMYLLSKLPFFKSVYHLTYFSFLKPWADDGSVQFSSVTQACQTLSYPMDCSVPGLLVHHQLSELAQTHVHQVGDAIQPFHPLSSPSPPTFKLSQHQGISKWVSSSHQVAKVLKFQFQHQSFQWIFRTDFL